LHNFTEIVRWLWRKDNRTNEMSIHKLARLFSWIEPRGRNNFNPGRRTMLRTTGLAGAAILLGGVSNLITACSDDGTVPVDDTCRAVDDFQDGNLTAEPLGANWVAVPGSNIVSSDQSLRVQGRRNASGEIGVELNAGAYPLNYVGDHDTLTMEIKAGRVDDPAATFSGLVRLRVQGTSAVGTADFEGQQSVLDPNLYNNYFIYYIFYGDQLHSLSHLSKARIILEVADNAEYFMEIADVRLCTTF
jgi:hypothetical protein